MNSYDVVIVNYNGEKIITQCLRSIYNSEIKPNQVIIYDNASKDKSVAIIKKKFPETKLIRGRENIGFGNGNNKAMRYSKSDFILFVNNDVLLDKKCTKYLIEGLKKDSRTAIVNPLIYKGWQKKKRQEIYSFGAAINEAGFAYSLYSKASDRSDLMCFSGACFLTRANIIKKIGFDKNLFLYYEEPIISIDVLLKGYKIARLKKSYCYHLENYSSPQNHVSGVSFRQYYGTQNRLYMVGRYWPYSKRCKALLINGLYLVYITTYYLLHGQWKYLNIWKVAYKKYRFGRKNKVQNRDNSWCKKLERMSFGKYLQLRKIVFGERN